jgi:hypothetical protein
MGVHCSGIDVEMISQNMSHGSMGLDGSSSAHLLSRGEYLTRRQSRYLRPS